MNHARGPESGGVVVDHTTAGGGDSWRGPAPGATTRGSARGRYVVTYDFEGETRTAAGVLATVDVTAARLRARGVLVEPLGATAELDATGGLRSLTVRYDAAHEGLVGWLNCLTCLPASGRPRSERE